MYIIISLRRINGSYDVTLALTKHNLVYFISTKNVTPCFVRKGCSFCVSPSQVCNLRTRLSANCDGFRVTLFIFTNTWSTWRWRLGGSTIWWRLVCRTSDKFRWKWSFCKLSFYGREIYGVIRISKLERRDMAKPIWHYCEAEDIGTCLEIKAMLQNWWKG